MLNVDVDPWVGSARKGWRRWNEDDIVSDPVIWKPPLDGHNLAAGRSWCVQRQQAVGRRGASAFTR
jgi:hypothetical protein